MTSDVQWPDGTGRTTVQQTPPGDPPDGGPRIGHPPPTEGLPDQGLRGDRVGVQHQGQEQPQLQGDLVGSQFRGPGPGHDGGRDGEGALQHRRAPWLAGR